MTPADPEALRVALRVVEIFERLGILYHVGGSYASSIHGVPRQTHDVDLVVDLRPDVVHEVAQALQGDFYVDEKAIARAVTDRSSCNLIHLGTGLKIDLFVKGSSAFDASEFERRVLVRLSDAPAVDVFVKSAEDTLLRKLVWFRLGGEVSERQWEDVRGVARIQAGRLDIKYLTRWADEIGVRDLLDSLLREQAPRAANSTSST